MPFLGQSCSSLTFSFPCYQPWHRKEVEKPMALEFYSKRLDWPLPLTFDP